MRKGKFFKRGKERREGMKDRKENNEKRREGTFRGGGDRRTAGVM